MENESHPLNATLWQKKKTKQWKGIIMNPAYPKTRPALGALLLVALFASSVRAPAADLKTIDIQESYVVDGKSIALTQNLGEVVIKLDAASAETVTEITTSASGTYWESRKLDKQS